MTRNFYSRFKKYILGLIQQKRALGYDYVRDEEHLARFDSFCVEYFPAESTLTKKIALKWAETIGNEGVAGRFRRIVPVRELAKYMNSLGVDSYVTPTHLLPRVPRYIPHLYTSEELSTIFSFFDRLPFSDKYPFRHFSIPVMLRMIYCCGLRPKEGRTVLRNNVNLKTGEILVQKSKKHKDRIVVLSADMLNLCQQYDKKIDSAFPKRQYFFENFDGKVYSQSWLKEKYSQCIEDTKMFFCGNRPRIYDLRHTFATNVLFRWMKEGKELNACLPYLSAYLGHEQFSDTAYYIHLVPQYFSQISDMCLSQYSHLIPEIENED